MQSASGRGSDEPTPPTRVGDGRRWIRVPDRLVLRRTPPGACVSRRRWPSGSTRSRAASSGPRTHKTKPAGSRAVRDQLAEARHEASRLREEAREQGARSRPSSARRRRPRPVVLIEAAHVQIEADRQQAFSQLRSELGRLSTDLAGRIVGESLEDEARQSRTVDRFLEELESSNAAVR